MSDTLSFRLPAGLSVQVQANSLTGYDPLLLGAYVPGAAPAPLAAPPDLVLRLLEAAAPSLQIEDNTVTLAGPWQGRFPTDAYHLLYGMVRQALLARGLYSVHGACLNGVLLAGHSGVGKTTVLMRLVQQLGWPVEASNKTVVSFERGIQVVAGTTTITVRRADIEQHGLNPATMLAYGDRCAFELPALAYQTKPTAIRLMVLPQLNDGVAVCQRLSPLSAVHTLYPYFLDTVNADVLVGEGTAVFSGAPAADVQQLLAQSLRTVCETVPVYRLSGPLDFVTQQLDKLVAGLVEEEGQ